MPRVRGRVSIEDKIWEAKQRAEGFSELQIAIKKDDLQAVRSILKAGKPPNLNCQESDLKFTPLCGALSIKNFRMIEALIGAGADVNMMSGKNAETAPLLLAVWSEKVEIIKLLLKNGANVHAVDHELNSVLHSAADRGYVKIARLLIEHGAKLEARNDRDETPLHLAAQFGQTEIVRLLIAKGADISATCRIVRTEGRQESQLNATALILAAYWGYTKIATILIEAGADVNAKTSKDCTALHFAAQNGPVELVNLLLKAGATSSINVRSYFHVGFTPLVLASKTGRVDVIEALLKVEGIEVNATETLGAPLQTAAGNGHIKIVKLLIAKGAQINGCAMGGSTPLHAALLFTRDDVAKYLLENGADVHAVDMLNSSPLHVACEKGASLDVIKILVEKGADINAKMSDESTPLQIAAKYDRVEIVKFLVDQGADLIVKTEKTLTALEFAAVRGSVKSAAYLAEKLLEIDAMSLSVAMALVIAVREGHREMVEILSTKSVYVKYLNLLHAALKEGHLEVAELLLKRNAPVNMVDENDGCSPLFLAIKIQDEKLVRLLLEKRAAVNMANKFGVLPIHIAAKAENVNIAKVLLAKGAYYNKEAQAKDYSGTPLDFARETGNAELVTLLELISELFNSVIKDNVHQLGCCIQAGAIINARNESGRTALHYAVSNRNVNAIKALLANDADMTLLTNEGDSPLQIAVANDCNDIAELLLERAKNLDFAVCNSIVNTKMVESRMTLLHTAVANNNFQLVKLLLMNGVVYNARNSSGKTPLQLSTDEAIRALLLSAEELFEAVTKGNGLEEVRRILKDSNAVINARKSDHGGTLLYWSILKGRTDIANTLLSSRADYCLVTEKGATPLHIAALKGNVEIVKELINRIKSDNVENVVNFINAATTKGTVALHVTSKLAIAKCLLQAGATYDICNGDGKTAMELTQKDVKKFLTTLHQVFVNMKKGASKVMDMLNNFKKEEVITVLRTRNVKGQSLVQVAVSHSHIDIASQLIKRLK